jgi:ABC-2 type transport system permease protein
MNKLPIIIKREFLTRVRKKSFILMSIISPFLFAALAVLPTYFATMGDKEIKTIAVLDSSHIFLINRLPETSDIKFRYMPVDTFETLKKNFKQSGLYAILTVSPQIINMNSASRLFSDKQPSFNVVMHIEHAMSKEIERIKLKHEKIENLDEIMARVKTNISIQTIRWTEDGKEKKSHAGIAMGVGYLAGFMIYIFIFLFGTQVMRGVIEEKSNRIVEVIVSSVKPVQLMLGKIIGIGLVGLTQFVIWVVFTFVLVFAGQRLFFPELLQTPTQQVVAQDIMKGTNASSVQAPAAAPKVNEEMEKARNILQAINDVPFGTIIGLFIIYFLGGFLLYAGLFAAIGSAVDNETETQQFMMPITIPLILSIVVMMNAIMNPEGQLAFWFSIIPLTSPVIMMARLAFGVPAWEIALSVGLLLVTFIVVLWLAAKIYRTGILMYGKKITWGELIKWLRYKV